MGQSTAQRGLFLSACSSNRFPVGGRWVETNLPVEGDFVELRGRKWLVEGSHTMDWGLNALRLACVDRRLQDDTWASLGRTGTDDPAVFSAYLPHPGMEHRH